MDEKDEDFGELAVASPSPESVIWEKRHLRMSALDWAIRTEDIASKGINDDSARIRERILEHADTYVDYVETGEWN